MTASRKSIERQFAETYDQWESAKKVLKERQAIVDRRFAAYKRHPHVDNALTESESASRDAAHKECEALYQQLQSLAKSAPYTLADS